MHFLSRVSLGRDLSMHETRKVAKGRVWTGEDALQRGLVDKLGGLKDAVHIAKQEAGLPMVSGSGLKPMLQCCIKHFCALPLHMHVTANKQQTACAATGHQA